MDKRTGLAMSFVLSVPLAVAVSASAAVTTITYVSWVNQYDFDIEKKVIDEFMRRNPGIRVKATNLGWEQYMEKLLTSIVGGAAPDCIRVQTGSIYQLATGKALQALNSYIKSDRVDLSDYFASQVEGYRFNGQLHALPLSINAGTIFYNKQYVQTAGVADLATSYDPKTWTRDAYLEAMKKLTRDKNGDGKPEIWGCGDVAEWQLETFVREAGGSYYSKDGRKSVFNSEETVDGLDFMHRMRFVHKVWDPATFGNFIWDKRSVTQHMSGWGIMSALKANLDFDCIPHYSYKVNNHYTSGDGIAVSASSKKRKAAWELAKFMAGEWAGEFSGKAGSIMPAHIAAAKAAYSDLSKPPRHKMFFIDSARATVANEVKSIRNQKSVNEAMDAIMQLFYKGKKTPKQAAVEVQNAVNRLLSAK